MTGVRLWIAVGLLDVGTLGAVAAPAAGTFPGANGRIAYITGSRISVVTPDGRKRELPPRVDATRVSWSPDGRVDAVADGEAVDAAEEDAGEAGVLDPQPVDRDVADLDAAFCSRAFTTDGYRPAAPRS